jgi:hypothetical protein
LASLPNRERAVLREVYATHFFTLLKIYEHYQFSLLSKERVRERFAYRPSLPVGIYPFKERAALGEVRTF